MCGFVAARWSDPLDFTTHEKLPPEFVSDDLHQRRGDTLWRVRFRDGTWLYSVVLLESQPTVDRYMAVRMLVYTGLLYQDLIRRGDLGPGGELPPVLSAVLYIGSSRWTAAIDVARLIAKVSETLARYQPSQRRFLLDEGDSGDDDLPRRKLVSAVTPLEDSHSSAGMERAVDALIDWLPGSGQPEIKHSFKEWIGRVLMPRGFCGTGMRNRNAGPAP